MWHMTVLAYDVINAQAIAFKKTIATTVCYIQPRKEMSATECVFSLLGFLVLMYQGIVYCHGSTANPFKGVCNEKTCDPSDNCCCSSMSLVSGTWLEGCCIFSPATCCMMKETCPANSTQPGSGGEGITTHHILMIVCVPVTLTIITSVLFTPRSGMR